MASSLGDSKDWQFDIVSSGWEAMERVQTDTGPQVLVLDLPRGDRDSLHILRWLQRLRCNLPIVIVCHPEDAHCQAEAIRLGAKEVLIRPIAEKHLEDSISTCLYSKQQGPQVKESRDDFELGIDAEPFLTASPLMRRLRVQAELLAQADVPILLIGEPGSGKATVARLIHKLSVNSGFKFQRVNCATMPAHLLQAKVFGQTNGAFADAKDWREAEVATEKGTLLLEEITELPMNLQTRLFQFLQEKQGPCPLRIIATSSAKIDRALGENRLREDLYYRLSAFTLQVPPLRQRKEEITDLLQYSMHKVARYYGKPYREFSAAVLKSCVDYAWPGNLHELEAFVKRYLVAGDSEPITISKEPSAGNAVFNSPLPINGNSDGLRETPVKSSEPIPQTLKALIQSVKFEAEKNAIAAALEKTRWNRKAAAGLLKVSYRSLLYKIEQYHMSAGQANLSPLIENRMDALITETKRTGETS